MLVYIEYISRRPGVSLEAFHKVMALGQTGWASDHADDVMAVMLGRTWRIGPEPEYMCVWYTKDSGLDRLDAWESVFRSGGADAWEEPFRLAARIDKAGCYEPLIEPVASESERFYTEFFDVESGAGRDDVRAHFEERAGGHDGVELCLLLDRIGHLGPDPRGIAVWSLPRWAALEGLSRELESWRGPVRPVTAALYSTLGTETL
jgi:hypothetical protein